MAVHSEQLNGFRAAFQEYLDAQLQFVMIADNCSKKGWADRGAVLYYTWQCQRLYIRRQEFRFGYLYSCGEFKDGAWTTLSTITDRLDKNWGSNDERDALTHRSDYKDLMAEIAEAELARASALNVIELNNMTSNITASGARKNAELNSKGILMWDDGRPPSHALRHV